MPDNDINTTDTAATTAAPEPAAPDNAPPAERPAEPSAEASAKAAALAKAEARIAELEAAVAGHQATVEAVRKDLTANAMAAATSYGELARTAHPEVPAELITGKTIAEIDAAITTGKAIVQKVKDALAAQAAASVLPGGQVRTGPDMDSLSPTDKIRAGVAARKK